MVVPAIVMNLLMFIQLEKKTRDYHCLRSIFIPELHCIIAHSQPVYAVPSLRTRKERDVLPMKKKPSARLRAGQKN